MNEQKQEEITTKATLGQTAAVFVPTAAFATVGIEALLHAPLPIEIAGLVGAYVAARNSPAIYRKLREHVPGLPEMVAKERKPGEYTFTDRLLGKHMHGGTTTVLPDAVTEPLQMEPGGVLETTAIEAAATQQGPDAQPVFERYPDDETLVLGHVLKTGQRFAPHFDSLVGNGVIASAVQGSGKSQFTGRLMEQVGKCGAPCFILDHKGEYWPVTQLPYIKGIRVGSTRLREKVGSSVFALTPENVDEFVAKVQRERLVAVIELPSYGDSWLDRATIVAEVGQALMRWSARQRELGNVIPPAFVVLDEAQLYLPQDASLLPAEARKRENMEILGNLDNAFFSLVSNGRSNGYTVCFATQSLTYIVKWAIKSCQVRIFMRHVEKNDLDACEKIINPAVAKRSDIESFDKGVGVVFGFTPQPMIVKFDQKDSLDLSNTPGIKQLRQPIQEPHRVAASSPSGTLTIDQILDLFNTGKLSEAAMLKLIDRLPVVQEDEEEPDTGALAPEVIDFQARNVRREVPAQDEEEDEEPESNVIILGKGCQITREEYQVAYRMRARGVATGYRDLMEPFDLSEHHAKALNKLILEEMDVRARG